jgi:transcriptional regulator with XRE-family HTH domain
MARKRSAGWDQPVGDRPDQHVGALLHSLREQAGVTQREVAQDMGIDPSLVSRVERGQRPASDRIIRYYGERFGAHDLLAGLVDIAREAEHQRQRLRDPALIARQDAYPLPGDAATFISETPPDGISIPLGHSFTKQWTIRNSGTVPWVDRRLRRIGPFTGPWTLTSPRFAPVPDAKPGEVVTIVVPIRAPHIETAAVAQWKMVDRDDLLFFPTEYSMGLGMYVLIGHSSTSTTTA